MAYKPSPACLEAARAASKGLLANKDLLTSFERVAGFRDEFIAEGKVDGLSDRVNNRVLWEAEATKVAAANAKRQAAISIIIKDRVKTKIRGFMAEGLSLEKAVFAIGEGTQKGAKGGRVSINASKKAYENKFIFGMFADIEKEVPHFLNLLTDKGFNDDITREMFEFREGGKPGSTGNKDAAKVAKIFADHAEVARMRKVKLGSPEKKLPGWAGVQVHDPNKLVLHGEDQWISDFLPELDIKRTFPEAKNEGDILKAMREGFLTFVTGRDQKASELPDIGTMSPANLANSLDKKRFFHFKDAEGAIRYNEKYGYGNAVSALVEHQRRAARIAAQMEHLGPNPENLFNQVLDDLKLETRNDANLSPAEKQARSSDANPKLYTGMLNIMTGDVQRPQSMREAKIAAYSGAARDAQRMSKLGASAPLAMITDTATVAAASMFRGGGFIRGLTQHIAGIMQGRPKGEQKLLTLLLGEGNDSVIDHIAGIHADANDAVPGALSKAAKFFFKWSAMNWVTDVGRAVNGKMVALELAHHAQSPFDALPDAYKHLLTIHGITPDKWKAIQAIGGRKVGGKMYLTPELAQDLTDAQISHLVSGDVAKASAALLERQTARAEKDMAEAGWISGRASEMGAWAAKAQERLEAKNAQLKPGGATTSVPAKAAQAVVETAAELKRRLTNSNGAIDMGQAGDQLVNEADAALKAGKKVTIYPDGKAIEITAIDRGMMADAKGQRWGVMPLLMQRDMNGPSFKIEGGAAPVPKATAAAAPVTAFDKAQAKLAEDLAGLQSVMRDLAAAHRETKGVGKAGHAVGLAEGEILRNVKDVKARMASVAKQMEAQGKDNSATFMADLLKREADLKEFTDRIQRNMDERKAAAAEDAKAHPERLKEIHDEQRHNLEMDIRRLYADEVNYGVLELDARSERYALLGAGDRQRPGTLAGEATRHVMQFKGFPIAFTSQVGARAVSRGNFKGRGGAQLKHFGALLAGLTTAGYLVNQFNNLRNGRTIEVPEDPGHALRIFTQSFLKGGAAGLYGDYLVGSTNRYGSTLPEAILGPTFGAVDEARTMGQMALGLGGKTLWESLANETGSDKKGGAKLSGRALNFTLSNTPLVNLFYTRPALDWLFVNSLREATNPGSLRRTESRMKSESGQSYLWRRRMLQN